MTKWKVALPWAVGAAPSWQERALCPQTDPDLFYPDAGQSPARAKRICDRCEVKAECLEYALANEERFGVWGGTSEPERKVMRRERRAAGQVAA